MDYRPPVVAGADVVGGAGVARRADEPADEPAAVAVDDARHHQNGMAATTGALKNAAFVGAAPRRYRRGRLRRRLVDDTFGVPVDPDTTGVHIRPRAETVLDCGGCAQGDSRGVRTVVLREVNRGVNVYRRLVKHVEVGEATSHDGGTEVRDNSVGVVAARQCDVLVAMSLQSADGGLAEVARPTGDQNLHVSFLGPVVATSSLP